jgi:hypothetical protein
LGGLTRFGSGQLGMFHIFSETELDFIMSLKQLRPDFLKAGFQLPK